MLVLASSSPRRQELLRLITSDFTVDPAVIDERALPMLPPADYVQSLAVAKARNVAARHPEDTIVAADTMVAFGDELLGKPVDAADAARMLHLYSGKHHQVYTGLCVIDARGERAVTVRSDVEFWPLTDADIDAAIASDSWRDKAGAYGIQDEGALFVKGIVGDFYNIMGLPVSTLARMLKQNK